MQLHVKAAAATATWKKRTPIELSCHDVMMHTCNILYAYIYLFGCTFSLVSLFHIHLLQINLYGNLPFCHSCEGVWTRTLIDCYFAITNDRKQQNSKLKWAREKSLTWRITELNGTSGRKPIVLYTIWTLLYTHQPNRGKRVNGPDKWRTTIHRIGIELNWSDYDEGNDNDD